MHIFCIQIWHLVCKERTKNAYRQALFGLRDKLGRFPLKLIDDVQFTCLQNT